MEELKKKIIACLGEIKGSGKFASIHTADFLFPGLEVDGVGEIAYPVNQLQAEALIKVARQAPFGKGRETIVDTEVRSVHEIDADRLAFTKPTWDTFLAKAIENVKSDLGLEDSTVRPHLYKLLIYQEGDFFLPHKDSEKEKGMFGTLIIGLPAQHTGGELIISFDGARKVADFAEANNNHKIKYAAFYADCDHEVKPITSGFRVCIVYNLILEKAGETAAPQLLKNHAHKLADVFSEGEQQKHPGPYLVLLGHQYTPENFSRDALKLDDRSKAEALLQAAKIKGYYAKLCLVTSYQMGLPENDGYGYGRYGYDGGESAGDLEMAEVYDEDLRIEHWANDELPGFNSIELDENDLITSFTLDDGEPVEKENTGYMGNYGPDLMYWYHYGAVMVWSPEQNAEMILSQQTKPQLEWIAYFTQTKEPSQRELSAVEQILISGFIDRNASQDSEDFNAIGNWLIQRKSEPFLLTLSAERLQLFFEIIDAAHWTKLLGNLSEGDVRTLLDRAGGKIRKSVLEKFIGIIKAAAGNAGLESIAAELTKQLPNYLESVATKNKHGIGLVAMSDLLWIFHHRAPGDDLVEAMTEALTVHAHKNDVRDVLIPALLTTETPSALSERLIALCRKFMQKLIENKPEPAADWVRTGPTTSIYQKQWQILKPFLASPDEITFDFRRNKDERAAMESAIRGAKIDLRTETIKKGSPHTLRIIKTQAAYERALKEWKRDVALAEQLEKRAMR